jgi:hypothetical protein
VTPFTASIERGGPASLDAGDRHAGRSAGGGGRLLDRDAEPAAVDAALVAQVGDDARDFGTGFGEADADRAACGRDDRGVHSHHVAIHIEGGTAGVARIDRRVELQEVVEGSGADVASARRDDAGGDRAAEAERVAGGQDPVADLDLVGIAPGDIGQWPGGLHLDHRDVGQLVGADDGRGQLSAVVERDDDAAGMTDHVVVRHDDPGGIDDEAGAGTFQLLLALAEAVAELLLERRAPQRGGKRVGELVAADGFGHRDVDDRGKHFLDQRREAVRRAASGRPGRRHGAGRGEQRQTEQQCPRGSRGGDRAVAAGLDHRGRLSWARAASASLRRWHVGDRATRIRSARRWSPQGGCAI